MKHKFKFKWGLSLCYIALVLFALGCKKDRIQDKVDINSLKEDEIQNENIMVLGQQLQNPYSIENMTEAKNNLVALGIIEDFNIQPNKLYVRFLPQDTLEAKALEADSTLELFDHPLDYEIVEYGSYYHDPSIEESMPTWLYTVVDMDYDVPGVPYEVLSELFLVNPDLVEGSNYPIDTTTWDLLEDEALKITGNYEDDQIINKSTQKRSKWAPKGRIQVQEVSHEWVGLNWTAVSHGLQPLRQCQVKARRWFTWKSSYTSSSGFFQLPRSFKGPVNYYLKFENHHYKVTDGLGITANYNGPKSGNDWYLNINCGFWNISKSWFRATFLNAIFHFEERAVIHNIKSNSSLYKIKVRAAFKTTGGQSSTIGTFRHYLSPIGSQIVGNDVKIYVYNDAVPQFTDDIYEVMMHELGHISHALKSPANWLIVSGIARESWAIAVEYYFLRPYYPVYTNTFPDHDRSRTQIIDPPGSRSWKYTPFFIDLIDTTDQREIRDNLDWARDGVQGYTLNQIQEALDHHTQLDGVCQNLENNLNNPTEQFLDALLEFYEDIENNH